MATPTLYWPMVESSLGIVSACLPLMRSVFTKHSPESAIRNLRSKLFLVSAHSNRSSRGSDGKIIIKT